MYHCDPILSKTAKSARFSRQPSFQQFSAHKLHQYEWNIIIEVLNWCSIIWGCIYKYISVGYFVYRELYIIMLPKALYFDNIPHEDWFHKFFTQMQGKTIYATPYNVFIKGQHTCFLPRVELPWSNMIYVPLWPYIFKNSEKCPIFTTTKFSAIFRP